MQKVLGTLLPFNSLWSRGHGSDYFASAKLFVDWLHETGQNVWQMLPINTTTWEHDMDHFTSPYMSYGVGLNTLLLTAKERKMTYANAADSFLKKNESWIHDYALFVVLSEEHKTDHWNRWPLPIRRRENQALDEASAKFEKKVKQIINQQAYLHDKFDDLKQYAADRGVKLWGDIPFYLPISSPLVWAHQRAFLLDEDGLPEFVAGSVGGKHFKMRQLWGFPLYDFHHYLAEVEHIWRTRIQYMASLFDTIRLDAAIRFFIYEKMHVDDERKDIREKGPGRDIFVPLVFLAREHGADIYIEDISSLDMSELHRASAEHNVAGISVLTLILGPDSTEIDPIDFDLHSFEKKHIYFTSSHDTRPLMSYIEELNPDQWKEIKSSLSLSSSDPEGIAKEARDYLVERCDHIVVAMQDWLLTKERINVPGVVSKNNWNYVMPVPIEDLPTI